MQHACVRTCVCVRLERVRVYVLLRAFMYIFAQTQAYYAFTFILIFAQARADYNEGVAGWPACPQITPPGGILCVSVSVSEF